jgi:hypothetical protein
MWVIPEVVLGSARCDQPNPNRRSESMGGFVPRATRAIALGVAQNPPYIQDSSNCPHSDRKS